MIMKKKIKKVNKKVAKKAKKKPAKKTRVLVRAKKRHPIVRKKSVKKMTKRAVAKKKKPVAKKKIKAQAKKKIPLSKERAQEKQDALTELIARGKQRGFVTEDEIIHILPDIEQDIDQLESLYEHLETHGVRIMGSEEMLKLETFKEEKETAKKIKKDKNLNFRLENYEF